jgi:hypothetical protein
MSPPLTSVVPCGSDGSGPRCPGQIQGPLQDVTDATTLESHLNRQAERSENFFWNRLRWGLILERLPSGEAIEVVDVGAGPGFLGDHLRRVRPLAEYRFIEPLHSLEEGLEERFGPTSNFKEHDSFGEARYVTLLDVLEHQEDDRAFLAELSAKMTPGSLLLLTVPAMPSLWSQWDVVLGHYRRYRKQSFERAIAGLPFTVEETAYLFPELLPLGWVRRLRLGRGGGISAEDAASAEFPDLSRPVNEGLYWLGRLTISQRRLAPAGTSLFAALRRHT